VAAMSTWSSLSFESAVINVTGLLLTGYALLIYKVTGRALAVLMLARKRHLERSRALSRRIRKALPNGFESHGSNSEARE